MWITGALWACREDCTTIWVEEGEVSSAMDSCIIDWLRSCVVASASVPSGPPVSGAEEGEDITMAEEGGGVVGSGVAAPEAREASSAELRW